jgi:hypothetical protein
MTRNSSKAKAMVPNIHIELLTNMDGVKTTLVRKYLWFGHETETKNTNSIRKSSLKPGPDTPPPHEVLEVLGDDGRQIVCLHPIGSSLRRSGTGEPPFAHLAISADDLPLRVGLDWSDSYSWSLAKTIRKTERTKPSLEVCADVAYRSGTVVSYDEISARKIRVCRRGDPKDDPSKWGILSETPDDEVQHFE